MCLCIKTKGLNALVILYIFKLEDIFFLYFHKNQNPDYATTKTCIFYCLGAPHSPRWGWRNLWSYVSTHKKALLMCWCFWKKKKKIDKKKKILNFNMCWKSLCNKQETLYIFTLNDLVMTPKKSMSFWHWLRKVFYKGCPKKNKAADINNFFSSKYFIILFKLLWKNAFSIAFF